MIWRRTRAFERAVAIGAALVLAAVLLHRADLAVIAAPLLLGTAVALVRSRGSHPEVTLRAGPISLLEGDPVRAEVTVRSDTPIDAVAVVLRHGPELTPTPDPDRLGPTPEWGGRLSAGGSAVARFTLYGSRWGRPLLGPVMVTPTIAAGLLVGEPVVRRSELLSVWPLRDAFTAIDAMPRVEGMVGGHRSRRAGEGTEIATVRPFQPGDRLRRINWRVSLRTDEPHVTTTESDRDTDVVLCLDTRYLLSGRTSTTLDTAVRAAAAVAEHYLRAGDRVALIDMGQPRRRIPPRAGRGHLVRIVDRLLDVQPGRESPEDSMLVISELSRRALVVVLTPLVGEVSMAVTSRLARAGRAMVVVDTLPADARSPSVGPWAPLAFRLWRMRRTDRIDRLTELGVPVVPWLGSGSLDEVLRDVSRAARAPRAVVR